MSLMIREYHTVMADAIEMIDAKRLEWDEKMYGGNQKNYLDIITISSLVKSMTLEKTYKVHLKLEECMVLWLDMMSHKKL